MAQTNGPDNPNDQSPQLHEGVPIEQEHSEELAQPRRAASAEFVVSGEVGSAALLREAMDPAHKSLTDALRLSYRVLQVVIVILVVLFLFSGLKTVAENQSGVLTRFGKIVPVKGQETLDPGLKISVPYPVGEFVLFDVQNRSVELLTPPGAPRPGRGVFWPGIQAGKTLEQATESARTSDFLRPGRDGSLVTRDGDLAHLQISVTYEIEDPVSYIKNLPHDRAEADRIVRLAVQNSAIHVAARTSLQELLEIGGTTGVKYDIQRHTQKTLDDMRTGITVTGINIPDSTAPLAIRKKLVDLGDVRESVRSSIESAEQTAERLLLQTAGDNHKVLAALIGEYEDALDLDNPERADALLVEIRQQMESAQTFGSVANLLARARAYQSEIEATLGLDASLVQSLLPAFRENPELIVRQRWLEAYATVLDRPDAEKFFVPPGLGRINMTIMGLQNVQEQRRLNRLQRSRMEAGSAGLGDALQRSLQKADEMLLDGPGRQLRKDKDGRVRGLGQGGE